MIRVLLILVVMLAELGCASHYQPDLANKQSARVRVVSTHSMDASASVLSGNCVPYSSISWETNTQRVAYLPGRGGAPKKQSLGMLTANLPEYASYSEHRVPAGDPISFAFYGMHFFGNRTVTCAVGARFTPVEGVDYQVSFSEQSGGLCAITVSRLLGGSDGKVIEAPVVDVEGIPRCNFR